jgi:hypothetical protein
VRFEVSRALDAVERRLSTDPLRACAVVDLGEAVRLSDLDGGRPADLLRLGMVVDALGRELADETVAVYPVTERGLLADTDLTSNERMVIRRWSDDGLVEVLPASDRPGAPAASARVREVAELTGLPVIGRTPPPGYAGDRYAPVSAPGGVALSGHPGNASPTRHPALRRLWRCPVPECPSFGPHRSVGQPPPRLAGGAAVCPRHGERLADTGATPPAVPVCARVGGLVRERFVVNAGRPVVVGRAPEDRGGVVLGPYLDEQTLLWMSRTHVTFELNGLDLVVTDVSTNGSTVLARSGPRQPPRRVPLERGQSYRLGEWDSVALHTTVELGRADRRPGEPHGRGPAPASVLADAPTRALRLPYA